MPKSNKSGKPHRPSLYGDDEKPVDVLIQTCAQYEKSRRLLLEKGMMTAEELAVMPDADVKKVMDRYFAYVHGDDKTLFLVRRSDVPALENLIIRLDK